jgi:hypothetical protein
MNLSEDNFGVSIWAPENMMRVVFKARAVTMELDTLRQQNAKLREEIARLEAGKRTSLEELYRRYEEGV